VWQSTPPEEQHSSDSSQQNSSAQASSDQQKAPDQSPAPPQSPCSANSQAGSSAKSDCKPTASKTKKDHGNHKAGAPAKNAENDSNKKVVRNGSTAEPNVNLSPGLNQEQAAHQIESTRQLLATSDANLKKLSGRPLTANQQDTVKQVESYREQAKKATEDGDVQRAYNLAVKANLLSAELAGH
jgi:hypothetical protein